MQDITPQVSDLPLRALTSYARGLGLRRLETTVVRFPTSAANYAVCSAMVEANSGAVYREVATAVATSSSETARARAVESACMKAKLLALETFTGIKGIPEVEPAPAATPPRAAAPVSTGRPLPPAPAPTEPCSECGAPLTYGHREFSVNMFRRPLCVACQIQVASSK